MVHAEKTGGSFLEKGSGGARGAALGVPPPIFRPNWEAQRAEGLDPPLNGANI